MTSFALGLFSSLGFRLISIGGVGTLRAAAAVFLGTAMLWMGLSGTAGAAAYCSQTPKEDLSGPSKVAEYLCDPDDNTSITVTLYRIEGVALDTLAGYAWPADVDPDMRPQDIRVVRNEVLDQANSLLDRFGDRTAPGGPRLMVPPGPPRSHELFLAAADEAVLHTDLWPQGFRHYYRPCGANEDLIRCLSLWQYVEKEGLDAIEADTGEWIRKRSDRSERFSFPQQFKLMRYLGDPTWPAEFMIIRSDPLQGGELVFRYFPRRLMLNVAIVRNVSTSQQPVAIDALLGGRDQAVRLRRVSDSDRWVKASGSNPIPVTLPINTLSFQIGIAVPIRLTWGASEDLKSEWAQRAEAEKAFERISSQPSDAILETTLEGSGQPAIRKRRDSFLPPEAPSVDDYVYGPEVALTGVKAQGNELRLGEGLVPIPTNTVSYVISFGFNKCNLTAEANAVLDEAAASAKFGSSIVIAGHAKPVGLQTYDLALSACRANAIRANLLSKGIPESAIAMPRPGQDKPDRPVKIQVK